MGCGLCQRWSWHHNFSNTSFIIEPRSQNAGTIIIITWLCCQQLTLSLTNSAPLWPQVTASSGLELLTAPRLCSLPQSPALPWSGRHGPAPVSSAPAIVKLSETDTTRHYPILSGASIQQGRALWYHSILIPASMMGWPMWFCWIISILYWQAIVQILPTSNIILN